MNPGAFYLGNQSCRFTVWAPRVKQVEVRLMGSPERVIALTLGKRGYFEAVVEGVTPGMPYLFRLDGEKERPDPASRYQPEGVHAPSKVIDLDFDWHDRHWFGIPLENYVIYELHVGTFSQEGTFDGILPFLDELKDLGVTALELMPVAQFPGSRNWGYDGVYPYAVQNSYGGPAGLRQLVDACHQKELAVVLDVVYNHLGPEGNYLGEYGNYFTDRYKTPWGSAINFDGPDCDEVRRYFLENALYWQREFHIDALRLDAVHAIWDASALPFLEELACAAAEQSRQLNRRFHLIAESDLDDTRIIRPRELGGFGLDAQWNDGFHHALHTLLTGEQDGYYSDYGQVDHLVRAYRDGFVYSGQYSEFRRRRYGNSSRERPARQFVVCYQNHDQIGNRMLGDRLNQAVDFEQIKLAAGALLLSPFIPLLFMGEEYGEPAPFQYFVSHGDPHLIEAVRKGRREEFAAFGWQGEVPDPQEEATFERCKLQHRLRKEGRHQVLRDYYRELLRLRKSLPVLARLSKEDLSVQGQEKPRVLLVRRWTADEEVFFVLHFGDATTELTLSVPAGSWQKVLDSAEEKWLGRGSQLQTSLDSEGEARLTLSARSLVLYHRDIAGQR